MLVAVLIVATGLQTCGAVSRLSDGNWAAIVQPQDGAKLQTFVQKLPGSTVEFKMVPVPGGKAKIGDKTVEVMPFSMCTTETPWEVFDQFLLSGEPSKPYEQKEFPPDAIARPSRPSSWTPARRRRRMSARKRTPVASRSNYRPGRAGSSSIAACPRPAATIGAALRAAPRRIRR